MFFSVIVDSIARLPSFTGTSEEVAASIAASNYTKEDVGKVAGVEFFALLLNSLTSFGFVEKTGEGKWKLIES